MENPPKQFNCDLNPHMKLALAIAILKSRRHPSSAATADKVQSQPSCSNISESDAIKWKRKSKQRKKEITRLKEDLKLAEDGIHHDVFPGNMMCTCYFFDDLGDTSPKDTTDGAGSDQNRFSDVLRRRFLRQVRLRELKRKRDDCSSERSCISDFSSENEMEQLRASVDFLVELCENSSVARVEGNFKNWSHQAVDFILATLKTLSPKGNIDETVESIVSSLILRLIRRMCDDSRGDESRHSHNNFQFYIQHLLRKLGTDPCVGQRVILSVSQRISLVAESLLFMDPFDRAFPKMHNCIYIMIQLIEFLVSDCLISWSISQEFELRILEDWLASIFHARKALELLEGRNALYMLYMDRVVGDLTRQLGQVSSVCKLQPHILAKLFG
ncbi:protein MULTIPOLAR SPINDLE 1-like isoform X1 [Primulina huaijiensis]|uniref:protein MULTIPOLAR SPINDLE 1-like isoform X1 n=1 Tax=Primulina huaijiensis TaxID=1492673 RepID=UPI003CC787E0